MLDEHPHPVIEERPERGAESQQAAEPVHRNQSQQCRATGDERLVLAIAVRPTIAPIATAVTKSMSDHCANVRR